MNNVPTFAFQVEALDRTGNLRVDVMSERLPEKFLGVGFDVALEGVTWKYRNHELGKIFEDSRGVLSLATFRGDPKRIVFGATLRPGESLHAFDGTIASFFLKIPEKSTMEDSPLRLQFHNAVLSVSDEGRLDVEEVRFESKDFRLNEMFRESQSSGVGKNSKRSAKSDRRELQLLMEAQDVATFKEEEMLSETEIRVDEPLIWGGGGNGFEYQFEYLGWFFGPFLIILAVFWWLRARKKV